MMNKICNKRTGSLLKLDKLTLTHLKNFKSKDKYKVK